MSEKFVYTMSDPELGWEILIARPRVLAGIARLKRADPNVEVAYASYASRHVLYQTVDKFISVGGYSNWETYWENPSLKEYDGYKKLDYQNEAVDEYSYPLPKIDQWIEKAKGLMPQPYVTISARLRIREGNRNFKSWGMIASALESKGLKVICTSPRSGSPPVGVAYLEDLIEKDDPDSMGIEMALHNGSEMSITTNTGAAGIMLMSNPKRFMIFGGAIGFKPGWDGMYDILAKSQSYRTKFINFEVGTGGFAMADNDQIAHDVIGKACGILGAK